LDLPSTTLSSKVLTQRSEDASSQGLAYRKSHRRWTWMAKYPCS